MAARFRPQFADVVSALPDALLALSCWLVWLHPTARGLPSVRRLVLTVLLEFFVIHSAAFMGVSGFDARRHISRSVLSIGGLALFYSLFLAAASAEFGDWWLLTSFWALVLNRLLGVFLRQVPSDGQRAFITSSWAFQGAAFLFAVTIGASGRVPRLGITDAVVAAQHFTVKGAWPEQPWTALAAGTLYFTAVALWELCAPSMLFGSQRVAEAAYERAPAL